MVIPDDVAVDLGRPTPLDPAVAAQWQSWIDQAYRAISRRAIRLGTTIDALDRDDVGDVVLWATIRRVTRPADGAESTSYQVSVDDGSLNQTRRYPAGVGDAHILSSWWTLLGLAEPDVAGWSGSVPYGRGL